MGVAHHRHHHQRQTLVRVLGLHHVFDPFDRVLEIRHDDLGRAMGDHAGLAAKGLPHRLEARLANAEVDGLEVVDLLEYGELVLEVAA